HQREIEFRFPAEQEKHPTCAVRSPTRTAHSSVESRDASGEPRCHSAKRARRLHRCNRVVVRARFWHARSKHNGPSRDRAGKFVSEQPRRARLLFLSHRLPFPPHSGAAIRTFNILRELSSEFE